MMNFSGGGHERNWVLHVLATETMLPYFRYAGWHDYARFAAFYVYHMKGHDPVMMKTLQYGAFVRHIPGIYNSTLTDMFVEKTNIHAAVAWTDRGI